MDKRHDMRPLAGGMVVFAVGLSVFLMGIERPGSLNFDEFHYVPAARAWLAGNSMPLQEHPPLGPVLIAAGIALWGDGPLGWRFMSAVSGACTLACMYFWAWALRRSLVDGLWAAAICLCNQLLYVQARIAMLDTFMMAFLAGALACFTVAWLDRNGRTAPLYGFGALMGCAAACKWFAVLPWACLSLALAIQRRNSPQRRPIELQAALACAVFPWLVYGALFVAARRGDASDFFLTHAHMYDAQLRVMTPHPYASHWRTWPLQLRPIWYAFTSLPNVTVSGVLLLGNPLLMWGGLVALGFCMVRTRSAQAHVSLMAFAALYAPWCVVPRKLAFFYYYYPAAMALTIAWVVATQGMVRLRVAVLVASAATFVYFWPLLADAPISASGFAQRMWLRSWI